MKNELTEKQAKDFATGLRVLADRIEKHGAVHANYNHQVITHDTHGEVWSNPVIVCEDIYISIRFPPN
jgi:hypothetical protein